MRKFFLFSLLVLFSSLEAGPSVLALAGSSRNGSYNQQLINESAQIAKEMGATVTIFQLDSSLPLYNEDEEKKSGTPLAAQELRKAMIAHDYIIISSPEYNGSLTPLLLNALDWASRDNGSFSRNAFAGKRFFIESASPGGGGASGLSHLKTILERLGGTVITEQVMITHADQYFSADHKENPQIKKALRELFQQENK